MHRAVFTAGALLSAAFLTDLPLASAQPGIAACIPGGGHDHYPFCNTSLSLDDRVRDLVSRIKDEDKPNLLTARGHLPHAADAAGQQALPYLGVPAYYWGQNCLHSSMFSNCTTDGRCSVSFPSGPSWAATFDRGIMRQMAVAIGKEVRAAFNMKTWLDNGGEGLGLECWGPVINMNRDPRWGRNAEGGSEDPYLMGQLGKAWTEGLQQGDGSEQRFIQVAVTLKHFDANSLEDSDGYTRHNVVANLTKYLLADYYWPAFKASILAGARGVMCSYNSISIDGAPGVPACLSPVLRAAREAWSFRGYVTSDSDSVADAYREHHYVKTGAEASCKAIVDGGTDIDSGNTFYDNLASGVSQGLCAMGDVDKALFNSFRVRFELGLFDPTADQPLWRLGEKDIGTDAAKQLNLRAALESLVLVQDPRRVLPLKKGTKIAVIGPYGNASRALIQVDTGQICPDNTMGCVKTPYQAIRALNAGGQTTFVQGVGLFNNDTSGVAAAMAAAEAADVLVLGMGTGECGSWHMKGGVPSDIADCRHASPAEQQYMEAEGHDRTNIDLPFVQRVLAGRLLSLNKPTVMFLLNGGMVSVQPEMAKGPAVVEAFYPGAEGANALALSLFGEENRWGKLPYTVYPAEWTAANSMLDHDVTHNRTYRYGADAVIPFGTGHSLTTFSLAVAVVHGPADGHSLPTNNPNVTLNVSVTLTNTGTMTGDEVVMAYLVPGGDVKLPQLPVKSLFDFQRVSDIPAGASRTATFSVGRDALLLADASGNMVSAPGSYSLSFETGAGPVETVDVTLTGALEVVESFPAARPRRQ